MEPKAAGLNTDTLSCIASSGKGGWFNRVAKRQFPDIRQSACDVIKNEDSLTRNEDEGNRRYDITPNKRREMLRTFRKINNKPEKLGQVRPSYLLTKSISPERQKIITFYNNQDTKKNLFKKILKIDERKINELCLRDSCNFSKASKTLTSGFESIKSIDKMKQRDEYYNRVIQNKQIDTLKRSLKVSGTPNPALNQK